MDKRLKNEPNTVQISRTYSASPARLFKAWADEDLRRRWLPGHPIFIRKANPDLSMRISWSDNSSNVNLNLVESGSGQCLLELRHSKLTGQREAAYLRAFWAEALDLLDRVIRS